MSGKTFFSNVLNLSELVIAMFYFCEFQILLQRPFPVSADREHLTDKIPADGYATGLELLSYFSVADSYTYNLVILWESGNLVLNDLIEEQEKGRILF